MKSSSLPQVTSYRTPNRYRYRGIAGFRTRHLFVGLHTIRRVEPGAVRRANCRQTAGREARQVTLLAPTAATMMLSSRLLHRVSLSRNINDSECWPVLPSLGQSLALRPATHVRNLVPFLQCLEHKAPKEVSCFARFPVSLRKPEAPHVFRTSGGPFTCLAVSGRCRRGWAERGLGINSVVNEKRRRDIFFRITRSPRCSSPSQNEALGPNWRPLRSSGSSH
jgi:hypothetical protein